MAISDENGYVNQIDDYKIVIDDPATDAHDFREHAERLSRIIVKSKPQFTVGIFGGWGTGKTTMMQMIDYEIKKNHPNTATTIWFDSWRYEREEYSLMIPLLRTIILTLHDIIIDLTDGVKKKALKKAQKGFVKMIKAVARGTGVNLGGEAETGGGKVSAGLTLDFSKILDEYESGGHIFFKHKKIDFHKHVSEYLKDELDKMEGHRLVIFIDDLDRCTPDGALEILESIKTFFDLEGIIYVLGMDPSTIDHIVRVKYGENTKISGLDYMQKIVQLPFQIPVWSDEDLGRTIEKIANETGLPKDITDKLLDPGIKDLIINSGKLNPRNIKRFINSLVLSYSTGGENIEVVRNENLRNYIIENYLKSMISIQTFYFRGEKWLRFLKTINNYYVRVAFLTHFITVVKSQNISYSDIRDKIKEFPTHTVKIYNEIIGINDEDLFTFLLDASIPLLRIDKIENYLRSVDTKNIDTTRSRINIRSYESIDKLKDGVEIFNEFVKGSNIHLPYLDLNRVLNLQSTILSGANLSGADLSGANLFGANLSRANLSEANLSRASLSRANLSRASLSGANLSEANLSEADFSGARVAVADLSGANLSGADLSGADLSGADLPQADLFGANLSRANLSGANLYWANLSGANLSRANLSRANIFASIIIEPKNYDSIILGKKSNFKNATCDKIDFIFHVRDNTNIADVPTENLPILVNNKKELKLILETRLSVLYKEKIDSILKITMLPE